MDNLCRLTVIMAQLRDPELGCPWDRKQTFKSIAPYTIEEAYEVADAIERGDYDEVREELGDLLFQVVYYAQLGREQNLFDLDMLAHCVSDKLIRRHPHVFGDAAFESDGELREAWEAEKARERLSKAPEDQHHSALDGVPKALPALSRACKLQKRASRVGFDWDDAAGILDKIEEEIGELRLALSQAQSEARVEEEMGDLLFSVVNLARRLKIDSEVSLCHANHKFERRFRAMENKLTHSGRRMEESSSEELEAAWSEVKANEPAPSA